MRRDESLWRHVWASAENEINKMRFEGFVRSEAQTKQHRKKRGGLLDKEWEIGTDFTGSRTKSAAMTKVHNAR